MTPRDIRLSFNEAAEVYDRVRPSYPSVMFDDLFARLPTDPIVIEVGPGTGQATVDLLGRGARVHAIEIGPAMAAVLRSKLTTDRLQVTVGDFETFPLPRHSADVVFCACAYHWISPTGQTDRPAEILRPGGTVAIVSLIQVDSPDDLGFYATVQPIYERYGEGHTGPPAPRRDDIDPPMRVEFEADRRFTDVEVRQYDWNQTYTASEFRDLMTSYSGTQMMSPHDRTGLLDDIESFVRKEFDGVVTRPLVVTLTTATRT